MYDKDMLELFEALRQEIERLKERVNKLEARLSERWTVLGPTPIDEIECLVKGQEE